ncbi:MAG: hypothetical protein OES34_10795 [Nitrosopumilus sp.]|nr:hypothetical protein [Nitrosopumilus sp.]
MAGDCAEDVLRWLNEPAAYEQALREQNQAAAANQDRVYMAGDGYKRMVVHPRWYHYWGRRLGYECWEDNQFLHEFERDNECVRVRSRPRRTVVGCMAADHLRQRRAKADGLGLAVVRDRGSKRFRKTYAQ